MRDAGKKTPVKATQKNVEDSECDIKHRNQNTRDLVRNKHNILACGRHGYHQVQEEAALGDDEMVDLAQTAQP